MKLLTKQSKKERFVGKSGFILYNPTPQQYESIKNLLENACEINENYDIVGDIDVSFLKYIYENLTNVSEEVRPMTLTEFEDALSKKIFIEYFIRLFFDFFFRLFHCLLSVFCSSLGTRPRFSW